MKARWFTMPATALLLSACDVAPSELDGLSVTNAEAYVVLRDQLDQMPERLGLQSGPVAFCVSVRSADDSKGLDVDPTLIARLQDHAPADLKAIIVSTAECHETEQGLALSGGGQAFGLFAFFEVLRSDKWSAGYGCGGLCGAGNDYAIYHIFGYPLAIRTGRFIS
jgi:hypothetical protein